MTEARFVDQKLSPNFWLHEFISPRDPGPFDVEPDPLLIRGLQMFRDLLNGEPGGARKAVIITSGIRSKAYNARIGGALHSQHMAGRAADIQILEAFPDGRFEYWPSLRIIAAVERAKLFTGRGCYPGTHMAHVDTRNGLTDGQVVRWVEKIVDGKRTWPAVESFEPWLQSLRKS